MTAIVVVTSCDDRFAPALAAMVQSLLSHLPASRTLHLYVVGKDLGAESRERLLRSWKLDNLVVRWLRALEPNLRGAPLWGRMTIHTYYRLLLVELLPPEAQRAIWLDCDVIVRRNLAELWECDFQNQAALAAQDLVIPYVSSRYGVSAYKELGLHPKAPHFNAGVMVVNLGWWRQNETLNQALGYLRRYGSKVYFWDQEALNAVLAGHWAPIDPRWNQIASVAGRSFFNPDHLDEETYQGVIQDPWIVHFAGWWKPWLLRDTDRRRRLFFQYLDQTAWAGWRPPRSWTSSALALYDARLRDLLYPLESWGMRIWRARSARPALTTRYRGATVRERSSRQALR
jgi:lipopolysaccharide biosynthesis glycosyltransferase